MKSFLVSKNYPFNTRPWSTLTRAFLLLGLSLIVRDDIMNKVIYLQYHLRKVIGKKMARWVLYIDQSISRNITHSKINHEEG